MQTILFYKATEPDLAMQCAGMLRKEFLDERFFVELTGAGKPDLIRIVSDCSDDILAAVRHYAIRAADAIEKDQLMTQYAQATRRKPAQPQQPGWWARFCSRLTAPIL